MITRRPQYGSLTVQAALDHDWRRYHISEKLDGVCHSLAIGESIIIGELMPDDSFFAFDVVAFRGQNICQKPKSERLEILDSFKLRRPANPQPEESAADFIRRILAGGGEGVVAAALDGPFGHDVCKIKRRESFDCIVVEKFQQSMQLTLDGEPAGRCPLLGRSFDLVNVGDVVEIVAFSRLPSGKFREPRLVRVRTDKPAGDCRIEKNITR